MSVFSGIPFRLNAFFVGLLALAAVGITAVGGSLSSASFESHIRHSTFPARMDTVAAMVERELIAPARALQALSRNPFFLHWIAEGGPEEQASQAFAMARGFAADYGTGGMNIVLRENLRYFQLQGQTEKIFTTSKERDPWFFAFEESGKPLGVNIHAANDPLYPGMIFFNQRMDLDGKFAGILSTGMKMDSVLDKLAGMTIGKRGAVMLARADGTLLTHTNKALVGSSLKSLPGYEKGHVAILSGRPADVEYINADNERILASSRYIPVLDLILVAEGNLHELLGGLEEARWYSIGVGVLCIIVGSIVGMLLIRTVTGPLHSIMHFAESLTHRTKADSESSAESADEASLPKVQDVLVRRKDELGNLARTLATMVESLQAATAVARQESAKALEESAKVREAMREVNLAKKQTESRTRTLMDVAGRLVGVAQSVKNASESLEKSVRTADDSAREQAHQLGEIATAMTQMTATVLEVAQNASVASETSNATRSRAGNGADVVRRAVNSIARVQEESSALKEDMGRLGESAQSIAHIISVISDIADQTNLLALNAAIEAARAGEAGRGFAVVADEVRKLAEKTMVSTVDVGNAIRDIQTNVDNSLARMDTAVQSVGEATALAAESGTALDGIVSLVDNTADQVRAIATAAEEQSATSEQINQSVNQATKGSRETAQAMDEATQAIVELSAQARVLAGLIQELNAG